MAIDEQASSEQDEVTRLVREGRRPADFKGRAQLAADKFTGKVPLGVDAPNKTARKAIGGAASLFQVLKYGFIGLLATLFGALFVWAGSNSQIDIKVIGTGLAVLAVGVFSLSRAWKAWKVLKAISRA